jgi:hypothetical protein
MWTKGEDHRKLGKYKEFQPTGFVIWLFIFVSALTIVLFSQHIVDLIWWISTPLVHLF